MAQIIRNSGFSTQDIVTAAKLHNLVDTAVLGPQSISAQTAITAENISGTDLLPVLDVSAGTLNKASIEDVFSSSQDFALGAGSVTGNLSINGLLNVEYLTTDIQKTIPQFVPYVSDPPSNTPFGLFTNYLIQNRYTSTVICNDIAIDTNFVDIGGGERFSIWSGGEAVFGTYWWGAQGGAWYFDMGSDSEAIVTPERTGRQLIVGSHTFKHEAPEEGGWEPAEYAQLETLTWVDFLSNTNVTFRSTPRIISGEVYVGGRKTDPEDEIIVDLTQVNNGVYSVTKEVVASATWDASLGDIRRAAVDVPTIGKILLNQEFVIPANEVWLVEYEGWLIDSLDDAFTVCWKTSENGVETLDSTLQYPSSGIEYNELNHFFTLEGGTEGKTINIIIRGAANDGTGSSDNFIIFSTQNNRKGVRRVTKMKV